jgi:hypothetical protein
MSLWYTIQEKHKKELLNYYNKKRIDLNFCQKF